MTDRYLMARAIVLRMGDKESDALQTTDGFEFGCDKCRTDPPSFMLFAIKSEDHFHVCCRHCGETICLREAAAMLQDQDALARAPPYKPPH